MKLTTLLMLAMTQVASAFPSWIGVYGNIQRHEDTRNPGAFTVLMNQDYFGLRAEVGVRANNGGWIFYPMTYAGNVQGNSKWMFVPTTPFQKGVSVSYVFHGYDSWGGHIWDSRNGLNYSFTAPAALESLGWGPAYDIPHGPGVAGVEIAAYTGTTYAIWGEGVIYYTGPGAPFTVKFSRKPAGGHWSAPVIISTNGSYPKIACSASGIHVAYSVGQKARYVRSIDGGQTWGSAIDLDLPGSDSAFTYARLCADSDFLYAVYNDYRVPERSTFYFRRIHRLATAWEAPRFIYTVVSYKTTGYVADFEMRGNTLMLSSTISGWYGFSSGHFHESLDGGLTWREDTPPEASNAGVMKFAVNEGGLQTLVYRGNSSAGAGIYASTRTAGPGSWSTAPSPLYSSDAAVGGLQPVGSQEVLLTVNGDYDAPVRAYSVLSGGTEAIVPQVAGAFPAWPVQDISDSGTISLVLNSGGAALGYPHYSVMSSYSAGTPGAVRWVGNTTTWPNPAVANESIWFNTETWPAGRAVYATVVYAIVDGAPETWVWKSAPMTVTGKLGNNDWWHVPLQGVSSGTQIRYATHAVDYEGKSLWNNNGGADFSLTVP